ncbi:unnamed protein product, partial [Didymodactylos carnosus]
KKWYYEKIDLDNEQLDFLKNVGLLNIKIALTLQIKPDVELVKILIFFGDNDDIFNILIDILNTINDIDEKFLENIRFIFDAISHFEHGHFNRKTENKFLLLNDEIKSILSSDEYEQCLEEAKITNLKSLT